MRDMAELPRGGSARKEYTMRDLPIAYGNSRTAKIWVNKTIELFSPREWDTVTVLVTMLAIALIMLTKN